MRNDFKGKALTYIPFIFIVTFFVAHLLYVDRVSYNVPHMDTWLILADLTEKYMQGNITFQDWVPIPHSEYFSLLGTPINYLTFYFFDVNYQVHTYSGTIFLCMASISLYRSYMHSIDAYDDYVKNYFRAFFVLILACVYNLNQWEIASFDCALGFFNRIWFYYLMFAYVDKVLHKSEKRIKDYVVCGILCVIAIIVISHAYFPGAIATVALIMIYDYFSKRDWKTIKYYLITAGFVIAAGVLYIATYSFGQVSGSTAAEAEGFAAKMVVFIKAILIMAGSPLLHQSTTDALAYYYIAGLFTLVVSVFCTVVYVKMKKHKVSYMPIMLLMYGYISIIIISYVRLGRFALAYMTSSRYVVETTLILVGDVWMLIHILIDSSTKIKDKWKRAMGVISAGVLLLTICFGVMVSAKTEWSIAPYRKAIFKQMAYNMLNIDYVSDEALGIAQAPAGAVREAVAVLEKYELSVFHDVKTSEELQQMRIESLEPYQYKLHGGIYEDSWTGPLASIYVKTGESKEITLRGLYPFEINGHEKIIVTVGDTVTEYLITEPEIAITLSVPANEFFLVTISSDFYEVNEPDIRELSFVFYGIDGFTFSK